MILVLGASGLGLGVQLDLTLIVRLDELRDLAFEGGDLGGEFVGLFNMRQAGWISMNSMNSMTEDGVDRRGREVSS